MPARPLLLAILFFWVATTGWLFYKELWPHLRSGQPPPYTIDLADEARRDDGGDRPSGDGKHAEQELGAVAAEVVEVGGPGGGHVRPSLVARVRIAGHIPGADSTLI